jgi:putative membrane fusion protein
MIDNGEISSYEEAVGYIIRDEKLFQGENYKNGISQIKTEGQRVAKGDPIFRYFTNNEESLNKKIAELDVQIQDAIAQNSNIYSSDIASIDKQIEENLRSISTVNKKTDLLELKKGINNALTKKAKLTGEQSPAGSYINELVTQRSKYEEKLNSGSEYINATVSGVVSYKVDGLEDKLTVNNIDKLTEEYLSGLKLKTGEMIPSSNESGKIVNNYYCYIATILKSDEAKNAEVNDTVNIHLTTGDEIKATIEYISEQENGNKLIVLKIKDCVEKLINYRKISFEIVWWSAKGLRVPNSSIIEEDGKKSIVRKRIGYTDKILVKVLKSTEDYSIIENYTSIELKELGYTNKEIENMKNISLYDEILLKPAK